MHRSALRTALLVLATAATGSSVPGDGRAAACRDREPTSWDIEVAPPGEPGERLVVSGRVVSEPDRSPLAGVSVYVYHADSTGNYYRAGHEKEGPRLCGVLRTNKAGEYRIRTRMPGGYGGFPAHIHFEVWGPRVARHHLFVNLMREAVTMDTSRALPVRPPASRRPDLTATDRPVYRGEGGVLQCRRDLMVGSW